MACAHTFSADSSMPARILSSSRDRFGFFGGGAADEVTDVPSLERRGVYTVTEISHDALRTIVRITAYFSRCRRRHSGLINLVGIRQFRSGRFLDDGQGK